MSNHQSEPDGARFAVIGNPVEHSLSPAIHKMFAAQVGITLEYDQLLASTKNFAAMVTSFFDRGGAGMNVTVPFKSEACRLCDGMSPGAIKAGAVNTIASQSGALSGYNTDGSGLVRDITMNLGESIHDKHILLLGAGGAVRGVVGPLLEEQPASLSIVNRTRARALELAAHYPKHPNLTVREFSQLDGDRFDIIINGTAASLEGASLPVPPDMFRDSCLAYDMMYGPAAARFTGFASRSGARQVADGLGMLVEQAADSFRIWHGVRPDTAAVRKRFRTNVQT